VGFIILISTCFIIFIGGLISFYQKFKENKKNKETNVYNLLGFIIIIIGAIIAFANGFISQKSGESSIRKIDSINNVNTSKQNTIDSITKVLDEKQDSIVKIQNMNFDTAKLILSQSLELNKLQKTNNKNQNYIISLQNKNFDTVNSLLSHSLELNQLQKANNEKQGELIKDLTGSNNRPNLFYSAALIGLEDTTYYLSIGLFNLGNYPIRDCYIEFQEFYEISQGKIVSNVQRMPPLTLSPISPTYFYHAKVPILKTGEYYHYIIEVHWDRGSYVADLKFDSTLEKGKRTLKSTVEFFTIDHHPLPKDYFKINR